VTDNLPPFEIPDEKKTVSLTRSKSKDKSEIAPRSDDFYSETNMAIKTNMVK